MSLKNLLLSGVVLTCSFALQNAHGDDGCFANYDDVCTPMRDDIYYSPYDDISYFPSCDCCSSDLNSGIFYVGGGVAYIDTHLPQNLLVASGLYDSLALQIAVGARVAVAKPPHNSTTRSTNRWMVYAGYQVAYNPCWLFGLEVGYKDLGDFNTTFGWIRDQSNVRIPGIKNPPLAVISERRTNSEAWDALLTARYLHPSGVNFFGKFGAAWVKMKLRENNLPIVTIPFFSLTTPLLTFSGEKKLHYYNIYPEIVLGAGYQLTKNLNLIASWSHIFGPSSTSRYSQELDLLQPVASPLSYRRVSQAPGYDVLTLALEVSFGSP